MWCRICRSSLRTPVIYWSSGRSRTARMPSPRRRRAGIIARGWLVIFFTSIITNMLPSVLLQTESDISLFVYSCITSRGMRKKRKQYSAQEKVTILKRHLMDNILVSDLCDEHDLHPNVFYRWQSQFFEGGLRPLSRRLHASSDD